MVSQIWRAGTRSGLDLSIGHRLPPIDPDCRRPRDRQALRPGAANDSVALIEHVDGVGELLCRRHDGAHRPRGSSWWWSCARVMDRCLGIVEGDLLLLQDGKQRATSRHQVAGHRLPTCDTATARNSSMSSPRSSWTLLSTAGLDRCCTSDVESGRRSEVKSSFRNGQLPLSDPPPSTTITCPVSGGSAVPDRAHDEAVLGTVRVAGRVPSQATCTFAGRGWPGPSMVGRRPSWWYDTCRIDQRAGARCDEGTPPRPATSSRCRPVVSGAQLKQTTKPATVMTAPIGIR